MRLNSTEQGLEQITATAVEQDIAVEEALEVYRNLPEGYSGDWRTRDKIHHPVLNPAQINQVLQEIIKSEAKNNVGKYTTTLIQKSHSIGYNNFFLNVQDERLSYVGANLIGWSENRMAVTIRGNAGSHCGDGGINTDFLIQGNVGDSCGHRSIDSGFDIDGYAGLFCGESSLSSRFNIHGDAGGWCGDMAERSRFCIGGDIMGMYGKDSKECEFTIQAVESLPFIKRYIRKMRDWKKRR